MKDKVIEVLNNMIRDCCDEHYVEAYAELLEVGLDNLACDDFFGSEQQSDPRGDGRELKVSIYNTRKA